LHDVPIEQHSAAAQQAPAQHVVRQHAPAQHVPRPQALPSLAGTLVHAPPWQIDSWQAAGGIALEQSVVSGNGSSMQAP
jgi:hypothetical protein